MTKQEINLINREVSKLIVQAKELAKVEQKLHEFEQEKMLQSNKISFAMKSKFIFLKSIEFCC